MLLKPIRYLLSLSLIISVFLFFILFNTRSVMFDLEFYKEQYKYNEAYEFFGEEVAVNQTKNIISYLNGKGELSDFFNEREKLHMKDVRALVRKGYFLYYFSIACIIIILFIFYKKEERFTITISKLLMLEGIIAISLISLIAIFQNNFDVIFTKFHLLFFDNELWILNPSTDNMINLLGGDFFFNASKEIIIRTIVSSMTLIVVGIGLLYAEKKYSARKKRILKNQG